MGDVLGGGRGVAARVWLTSAAVLSLLATAVPNAVARPTQAQPQAQAHKTVGGDGLATRGVALRRAPGVPALPAGLTAAGWLVADLDTGEVLAARDPHGKYAPASTIKMLTATALIPRLSPTAKFTPEFEDVNVAGSKVGLVPGTRYSVATLFRSLLVVSGNDAANTLASAAGGTHRTVFLMNQTARELGAYDTVARNPHGLDAAGQTSSPYDLALIARAGLRMHDFAGYVRTLRSRVNAPGNRGYEIYNHNKLLRRYPGAFGVKNGYTVRAKASFVGAAKRGDRRLVVSLMRASPYVWREAEALLDWGFAAAGKVEPAGFLVGGGSTPQDERARRVTVGQPQAVTGSVSDETESDNWFPGLRQLVSSLGAAVMLLVLLRLRARRRVYYPPSRLKLPPVR